MRFFLLFGLWAVFFIPARSQSYQSNWENYVMEVNRKPVSVVVDLGLKSLAPIRDRPYVVIVRTKLLSPEPSGQPGQEEMERLDAMEDQLVSQLSRHSGAFYAGRFTQRGLREFYFYALDSVGYLTGVQTAMSGFPEYQFLCQAKEDRSWQNYLQVLYPSEKDMEAILHRRQIDLLAQKGDGLNKSRRIDHFFYFPSRSKREEFMRNLSAENFQLASMEDGDEGESMRYSLQLFRNDIPDYRQVNGLFMPLWERARKFQGRYAGWETYVVK